MLTAYEYRKRNRKIITLPSGGDVEIRKLSLSDFLKVGDIPSAFLSADASKMAEAMSGDSSFAKEFLKICLTHGVTSICIVDKPVRDCDETELSVEEIPPADQGFIASAIAEFTNLGRGAEDSIERFQEKRAASGND